MTLCQMPEPASLIDQKNHLSYLDCQCLQCDPTLSALQIYVRMTERQNRFVNGLFKIRDWISGYFGIPAIHGFGHHHNLDNADLGQDLDFFKIEGIDDTHLILTRREDDHLEVMVSLFVERTHRQSAQVFVTTSVITKNMFGKIYMVPVAMIHGWLVRSMLKKVRARA